jgi:uncharacterized protein YoxC
MEQQNSISYSSSLLLKSIFALVVWFSWILSPLQAQSPCQSPVSVQVGDIDPHFMLSEQVVIDLLSEVQQLWASALNRDVVQYDPQNGIPIHFVYGKEQRYIQERQLVEDHINHQRLEITQLQTRYDSLYRVYKDRSVVFEKTFRKHNSLMNNYNETLKFTNINGGISSYEHQKLKNQKEQLTTLQKDLSQYDQQLDTLLIQINDLGNQINSLKTRVREKANQIDEQFGKSNAYFQGKFINKSEQPEIQIFHFKNITDLKLVLAHEIGHALGIGHVDNPHSVMYYFSNDQDTDELKLSDYDIQALKDQCSSQSNTNLHSTL